MTKKQLIKELDAISQRMNGLIGRLTVAPCRDFAAYKEIHEMAIDLGFDIDVLVNKLMGAGGGR